MGIGTKLATLTAISLTGMIISLYVFVHSVETSLYNEKKAQTQRLIEAGMAIVTHFHNLEVKNILNGDDARNYAIQSLGAAKYGETGYYWINNVSGEMLMNPNNPELVGTFVLDVMDTNGNYPFQEIVDKAIDGGGWVEYYWPRPGSTKTFRKLSYVRIFTPWDWVLGTGIYLDDMEAEISKTTVRGIVIISIIFVVLVSTSFYLSRRFMNQLKDIAIHDPLTSLFTRRYLIEAIPIFLSKHERGTDKYLSVTFFDIDNFKDINDSYGHPAGDQVLSRIGETIKKIIRKGDLGIRYGGEEFVVVMLSESRDDAIRVAERIREKSNQIVFDNDGKRFTVTLSAGIAFRDGAEEFNDVINRADKNLYTAKSDGRNRLVSQN